MGVKVSAGVDTWMTGERLPSQTTNPWKDLGKDGSMTWKMIWSSSELETGGGWC